MTFETWLIPLHAVVASYSIIFGPFALLRSRRDALHRRIGRSWIIAVVATSVTGLFIFEHGFTLFHALALWTLTSVALGMRAILRGNVASHRAFMLYTYLGTFIAFGFAVTAPTRAVPRFTAEQPWSMLSISAGLLASTAVLLAVLSGRVDSRSGRAAGGRVIPLFGASRGGSRTEAVSSGGPGRKRSKAHGQAQLRPGFRGRSAWQRNRVRAAVRSLS